MNTKALIALVAISTGMSAQGQIIVADDYNVAGSGTGFTLNAGVNTGINPPTTRLTGSASANLSYVLTATTKADTAFGISGSKLRVTSAANAGRFSLSANNSTAFNFASVLGTSAATAQSPVVYDLSISMVNGSPGTQRFSFAFGSTEGDATTWDFGIQLYRASGSDNFYTVGKRVDSAASGTAADVNTFITNTPVGTANSEISFLMRVTDAGSETTTYNSRVQLSTDGGQTWLYDTATDSDLPNGWRMKGAGRYVMWDVAPDAGNVSYDNFSVRRIPLSAALTAPAQNAQFIGASTRLKALVTNSLPENVTVTFYGRQRPKINVGPDFLIPVLPDTQNYAREAAGSGDATKEMWFAQTDWIITNRVAQNIPFVATLGDCVNTADSLTQWRNATNAMYRLEKPSTTLLAEGIPYGITVGNHDQDPNGDLDGSTAYYNQFFGTSHFDGKSYYGGNYDTNNDSWYQLFSAGGLDFLVISFEYGRYGSFIMDWARDVMAMYPTRRVIVLTHYAGQDVADVNATTCPFGAQGQAIYTGLRTNANFFLMMSGHVFNDGGEGRRADTFQGHTVRTLVSDYQGRFNGGNGLMRLMYFSPSNNLVSVKTFSPYTGNYEIDANSQFSFSYNMQPNGANVAGTPFVAVGTNLNVTPGSESSVVWAGLQGNKTYEWYAKITDASGYSIFTAPRTFTTTVNAAPVANSQTVNILADQATTLTLLASDSNGDPLTFQTNSRPVNGLNSAFNPTAGTIVYQPAHGYRGNDQFTYRANDGAVNSGIATFNLNVTAPPDTNSNGLPDAWENSYGITNPNADDDGDGQSNLAEYLANTNPTNASSLFQIQNATILGNGAYSLQWPSVGGSRYRVQFSNGDTNSGVTTNFTDLVRSIDLEMDSSAYGTASTQTFTDSQLASTNRARYYRVKIAP